MSANFATSFYNDSSDGDALSSPGFRPGTGFTGNTVASDSPADLDFGDERRPSVASVTTASSTGSKSSANRIHKKLHSNYYLALVLSRNIVLIRCIQTSSAKILTRLIPLFRPTEEKFGLILSHAVKEITRMLQTRLSVTPRRLLHDLEHQSHLLT